MIPGFSNAIMQPGSEKESQAKIKRYMTIMDSMTGGADHAHTKEGQPSRFQDVGSTNFAIASKHLLNATGWESPLQTRSWTAAAPSC